MTRYKLFDTIFLDDFVLIFTLINQRIDEVC